ncbi:hypothetical protein [Streptomyces sp. TLI_053]|uniref:hypothetical protein n=1 Tax=Streptomyces sp. TLI_053 TaxID=1855352 RepID=UPI0013521075|nr:hypothetical protein [Streptomyces sp. TLI_053]
MSLVVRSGPLTEQQERWWLRLYWREKGDIDNAWSKRWDLPAGVSVAAATAALTALVERHEVLRTGFGLGPDHLPYQLVFAAEGFRLPLTVAGLDTLAEYTDEGGIHPLVGGSMYTRPPWSVRLFVEDDEVRVLSLVFEHILLDGSGVRNLREQFLALCGEGPGGALRITHPLDRAAGERRTPRTPEGRPARSRDPRELAPRLLVPATVKEETPEPRFLMSAVRYEGFLPLLDRVCRTHRVSRAMVLMHAVGWLISRYSGIPRIMVVNAIGLRLPSDDSVDLVAKAMEVMVDLDEDRTLAESLTAVAAGFLRAYTEELRLGLRDQDARLRLEKERGIGSVRGLYFNYQGPSEPDTPEPAGSPSVPETGVSRTDEWRSGEEPWSYATWIYVDGTTVSVDFDVDAVMLPAGVVHRMAELLPAFVRLVAERPDAPLSAARTLLPPDFARDTEARLVRGTWVHLDTVAGVIAGCPGVLAAEAAEEDGDIVARVSLDGSSCLFDVHEYVLSRLHLEGDLIAPHRYRLAGGSASRATGPGLPDLAAGAEWRPGDGTPVLGPATEPERELVAALQETHGFGAVNLALTYAEAGGRAILAPAVVETLRRRGLEGLRLPHFATAHTLRAVAGALVRRTPGHAP